MPPISPPELEVAMESRAHQCENPYCDAAMFWLEESAASVGKLQGIASCARTAAVWKVLMVAINAAKQGGGIEEMAFLVDMFAFAAKDDLVLELLQCVGKFLERAEPKVGPTGPPTLVEP